MVDRRGSNPSMMSFVASSLRDKLSSNVKGRMDKFRRLSTLKKPPTKDKRQLGSDADVIEEVRDDETTLDQVMETVPDDLDSEAFDTHYDVIGLAEESNPFHQDIVKALTFFKNKSAEIEADFDPVKAAKSKQLLGVNIEVYANG